MSIVSYAQNGEDILLWRALGTIKKGVYIDVGANDPIKDSVTKLFYDKGWRGINIEPVKGFYDRLMLARPKDINLNLAISDGDNKQHEFYEFINESGLSTLDHTVAQKHRLKSGFEMKEYLIETHTLNQVCEKHKIENIHFLKVDTEGYEKQVLNSIDLAKYKPWIILVEAIHPVTRKNCHKLWEDLILKNNYEFVFFDGLNRFYLAKEHTDLKKYFETPLNCFDDFIRIDILQRIESLGKSLKEECIKSETLRKKLSRENKLEKLLRQQREKNIKVKIFKVMSAIKAYTRKIVSKLIFLSMRILNKTSVGTSLKIKLKKLIKAKFPKLFVFLKKQVTHPLDKSRILEAEVSTQGLDSFIEEVNENLKKITIKRTF